MAKSLTLLALPHPHSQNLNQILHKSSIVFSQFLWPRISSSNFHNFINKFNYHNDNYVYSRRFPCISTSQLSSISNCHHHFCKSCNCFRFSSISLLPLFRPCLSSLRFIVMSQNHENGTTINQDSSKTVRCMIKGRVQGVFYRNWTIENATQLGLKGWVRNRRDGSVEALFSGKAESVNEMLQRCRRGPPNAMVTALNVNPSDEDPGSGFERKPTI